MNRAKRKSKSGVARLSLLGAACVMASCALACVGGRPPPAGRDATSSSVQRTPDGFLAEPAPAEVIDIASLPWAPGHEAVAQASLLIGRGALEEAQEVLEDLKSGAAALLRARILRLRKEYDAADVQLSAAAVEPALRDVAQLEQGLLLQAKGDDAGAAAKLAPLLKGRGTAMAAKATLPLARSLAKSDPAKLLAMFDRIEKAAPSSVLDARSMLLEYRATALEALGKHSEALTVRVQRYVEEAVAPATPHQPPVGATLTSAQRLARAERLVEANRSERALVELRKLDVKRLGRAARCRYWFATGVAARKRHEYADAERNLTEVVRQCSGVKDLSRRAAYLNAKVISIRAGLRAIPPIENFASRFAGHSMVDDVLFWAGDLYQRRGRDAEAKAYYERAAGLPKKGDYCAASRWRLAWMMYRRNDLKGASKAFARLLKRDGCVDDPVDRARAHYWLGRAAQQSGKVDVAVRNYQQAGSTAPLSYYAQLALGRLLSLSPERRDAIAARYTPQASGDGGGPLCAAGLAKDPVFKRGLTYLLFGLTAEAASELLILELASDEFPGGGSRSPSPRRAGEPGAAAEKTSQPLIPCGPAQARLLLAALLDRAGASALAHARLRATLISDLIGQSHETLDFPLWRAAYPLAYRDLISNSEDKADLPAFLLQALVREESAFDPQAVSWAGAHGLTQLMPAVAKSVAARIDGAIRLASSDALLDPNTNIRLGGVLLGSEVSRFEGYLPLALAAYNAGAPVATEWRQRHAGQPLDVLVEELTIRETRRYVKRVLGTYGVYRWLYSKELPVLDGAVAVPRMAAATTE